MIPKGPMDVCMTPIHDRSISSMEETLRDASVRAEEKRLESMVLKTYRCSPGGAE